MGLGKVLILNLLFIAALYGADKSILIKEKSLSNTVTLQSLRIETDVKDIETLTLEKKIIRRKIKAIGTYSDGHEEEISDHVRWERSSREFAISRDRGELHIYDPGAHTVEVISDDICSEPLTFTVVEDSHPIVYNIRNNSKKHYGLGRSRQLLIRLMQRPTHDVQFTLHLKGEDRVAFDKQGSLDKEIILPADRWNEYQGVGEFVSIVDLYAGNNSYTDYTIQIDPYVSEDSTLNGLQKEEIIVHKDAQPVLITPAITQLRGAVPGATIKFVVSSYERDLTYSLVSAPEGVRYVKPFDTDEWLDPALAGGEFEWKVPLGTEAKRYDVTVKAEDIEGKAGEITFGINVPKTTPIQTEVINNELTVTDTTSRLYGMKMKGHDGEDISNMKLLSVDYKELWRKAIGKQIGDVVEYIPFVIYNMPAKIDMKFPNSIEKLEDYWKVGAKFVRNSEIDILKFSKSWIDDFEADNLDYGGVEGLIVSKIYNLGAPEIFLLVITKSQELK